MTAQITDTFRYRNRNYNLIGLHGGELFDPSSVGILPVMMHTACHRGFICTYAFTDEGISLTELITRSHDDEYPEIAGVQPTFEAGGGAAEYTDLRLRVDFSGGILLARDLIRSYYVPLGCQKPHAYKVIKEFLVSNGKVTDVIDHSTWARRMRWRIRWTRWKRGGAKQGSPLGDMSSQDYHRFIERAFRLDYGGWGLPKKETGGERAP